MSQETFLALIIISPFLIALIALPFWGYHLRYQKAFSVEYNREG